MSVNMQNKMEYDGIWQGPPSAKNQFFGDSHESRIHKPQENPGAPNNQIYGKLASQAKFGDCGQNPGAMTRNHQKLTV